MTGYRQVAFKTSDPDNWKFQSVEIKKAGDEYFDSTLSAWDLEESNYYMEVGEYVIQASLSPKDGYNQYIGGQPQTVTLGATDTEIVYDVHPENYHQVTVAMADRDGNPMPSLYISLYSVDGAGSYSGYLDSEGKTSFMLYNGKYSCAISEDSNSPDYYKGEFTVAGEDMTVNAAMGSNWLKLAVKITGDMVADFISNEPYSRCGTIYISSPHGGNGMYIDLCAGENNTIVSEKTVYYSTGQYEYSLTLSHNGRRLHTGGPLNLERDYELSIDLSSDKYGMTTLEIVDAEGKPTDEYISEVRFYDSYLKSTSYDYNDGDNMYYLSADDYTVSCRVLDITDEGHIVDEKNYVEHFTVTAGENCPVTLRLEEGEAVNVDIEVKLPQELVDLYQKKGYDEWEMYFCDPVSKLGLYNVSVANWSENTARIQLPKGTYTYELWPEGLNRTATIDIQGDTTLSFDLTNEPYLHVTVTDEAGNPLTEDNSEVVFYVYQDGQNPMVDIYEFIGFLAPGTYQVSGYAALYSTYRIGQIRQTVTMGTTTQHINITVPTPEPNSSYVEFYVNDGSSTIGMPGTVTLNGITVPLDDGWAIVVNLLPGSYPYTVQAEGYEPCTGTVEVYVNTEVQVYLTRQSGTTGIDAPAATADGMFRLFPTVATDALHILPGTVAGGEWTVRITSSQGMAMYAARHVLDVETVLPVGNLAPGLYLLTLDNGTETVTYKFVKR